MTVDVVREAAPGEMETTADVLRGDPFFAGLGEDALRLIAQCAVNVHFNGGELILGEGEPVSTLYVIRRGRVALETCSPGRGLVIIDTVDEGDVLGWTWLSPPRPASTDARAVVPVSAIAIDGDRSRDKCEADPRLGYILLMRITSIMYQRMESAWFRLTDMYAEAPG
jgi:CRP/FNR family transcriptional regulator, cyclic AMP receptor protein